MPWLVKANSSSTAARALRSMLYSRDLEDKGEKEERHTESGTCAGHTFAEVWGSEVWGGRNGAKPQFLPPAHHPLPFPHS